MFSRDKRLQGFSQNLGSFVHGLRPVTILKRKNPLEAVDEVVYHVRTGGYWHDLRPCSQGLISYSDFPRSGRGVQARVRSGYEITQGLFFFLGDFFIIRV